MKTHPSLSFLIKLIRKGCCLETANYAGKTTSNVLISKGFPRNITEILTRFVETRKTGALDEMIVCMGRSGCAQSPVFQISCPHKPSLKVCANCFPLAYKKHKCGCKNEDISSIPVGPSSPPENSSRIVIKTEIIEVMDEDVVIVKKEAVPETDNSAAVSPKGKRKLDNRSVDNAGIF